MRKSIVLIFSVLICILAGAIGVIFTSSAVPTWYAVLRKPPFNPPNYLFGPVWTLLYVLMGISLSRVWQKVRRSGKVRGALAVFFVQLFLNATWSPIFFGVHNIFFALLVIAFLWIFVLMTIYRFSKVDKTAAVLLYPYFAWVTFAVVLNYSIWILNK